MSKILYRAVAFLLVITMLFGCISCEMTDDPANGVPEYDENQRFELITDSPTYSEEFIERAAEGFADIGESLVLLLKNINITEEQKIDLKNYFKKEIFSIIVMAQIYSYEVDALFGAMLEYLGGEEKDRTSFEVFANLYAVAKETLNAKKVGIVTFELSKMMIEEKCEQSRKRYEKYGYDWCLSDAVKYEALSADLSEKLGRDKFIRASDMLFFVFSSLYGIGMPENESGFSVNGREAAMILEMQADHFRDAAITVDDWRIFAGVLTELVPENNKSHASAELYALKKNGYFVSAIEIMPQLITLYEAATNRLCDSGASLYADGNEINLNGIIDALLESKAELESFLDNFETKAATCTKAESDAIKSLKLTEDYESFIGGCDVLSRDEFIAELRRLTDTDAAVSREELYGAIVSYTAGFAPYLTFAAVNKK